MPEFATPKSKPDLRIEVTVPLNLTASMTFMVDPDLWAEIELQQKLVADHVRLCQRAIDRTGTATPDSPGQVYFVIDDFRLAEATVYDPAKEGN